MPITVSGDFDTAEQQQQNTMWIYSWQYPLYRIHIHTFYVAHSLKLNKYRYFISRRYSFRSPSTAIIF